MTEPEGNRTTSRKVFGFVVTLTVAISLTVIAIPLLLLAACFPLMAGAGWPEIRLAMGILIVLAVGSGIFMAVRAENPGVRWGLVVCTAALMIAALYFLR